MVAVGGEGRERGKKKKKRKRRGKKITRISPNSPPNAPYTGDLKGQIRWFLTLSALCSLPVFAEPNASPSAASVCPLLQQTPLLLLSSSPSTLPPSLLLPLSLPPSDPVTAPLTQNLPNPRFCRRLRATHGVILSVNLHFYSLEERLAPCSICIFLIPSKLFFLNYT